MPIEPITGLPGINAGKTATHKRVLSTRDGELFLPGGVVVAGSESRDAGNTGDLDTLRPGVILGKITSSEKFAPSILGVTTVAYTAGGTSLTVAAATAVELVRRVGSSGTFELTGPPTSGGTVATQAVTYSAVNTTTGVITITALAADSISGSFVQPDDGSENMLTFVGDGFGLKVTDSNDADADVQLDMAPVGGIVDSSQLVNFPSDTSLQQFIVDALNGVGQFVFDHKF